MIHHIMCVMGSSTKGLLFLSTYIYILCAILLWMFCVCVHTLHTHTRGLCVLLNHVPVALTKPEFIDLQLARGSMMIHVARVSVCTNSLFHTLIHCISTKLIYIHVSIAHTQTSIARFVVRVPIQERVSNQI